MQPSEIKVKRRVRIVSQHNPAPGPGQKRVAALCERRHPRPFPAHAGSAARGTGRGTQDVSENPFVSLPDQQL